MRFLLKILAVLFLVAIQPLLGALPPEPVVDVFKGNRRFSDAQLVAYLQDRIPSFSVFSLGDSKRADRIADTLREYYQRKGFPLAQVQAEQKRFTAEFHITEGPRASLHLIHFEGNRHFSSDQLKQWLKLKGHFSRSDLDLALKRIQMHYHDQGFAAVKVGPSRLSVVEVVRKDNFPLPFQSGCRNELRIEVPIDEGAQYHYGEVQLPDSLGQGELAPPTPGAIYSERELVQFRKRVRNSFEAKGRLVEKFDIYQRRHEDARSVDLLFDFKLMPELVVAKIEFTGNSHYPDSFYRRELKLPEQRLFDARKLRKSLERLQNTGVIRSYQVNLDVKERRGEPQVIVHIHLNEKKTRNFLYSLGGDGFGGVQSSFIYSIFNLLGLGEELGVNVSLGSQTTELVASLGSRYLFGTDLPVSLLLRFFKRHTGFDLPNLDRDLAGLLNVDQVGFDGGFSYQIHDGQEGGLTFTAERVRATSSSAHFEIEPFWSHQTFSNGRLQERLRISEGFSFFSGAMDSSNLGTRLDYRRYFGPSGGRTLAFRIHLARTRFHGAATPVTERLFGEPSEIRGFSAFSAGPWARFQDSLSPVGGDTLATFNSEYRIPVKSRLTLVPFFDVGANLALTRPPGYDLIDRTTRVWRASLGGEVRVRVLHSLPPVRLIYAWNPLRLDTLIMTPRGWGRLRDPLNAFKISLAPPY